MFNEALSFMVDFPLVILYLRSLTCFSFFGSCTCSFSSICFCHPFLFWLQARSIVTSWIFGVIFQGAFFLEAEIVNLVCLFFFSKIKNALAFFLVHFGLSLSRNLLLLCVVGSTFILILVYAFYGVLWELVILGSFLFVRMW